MNKKCFMTFCWLLVSVMVAGQLPLSCKELLEITLPRGTICPKTHQQ